MKIILLAIMLCLCTSAHATKKRWTKAEIEYAKKYHTKWLMRIIAYKRKYACTCQDKLR